MMQISMIVAEGSRAGAVIPVTRFPFVIGRAPECHLRPTSDRVSKHHCQLQRQAGRVVVSDLNSTNGTFLKGERIAGSADVRDGDLLQVGPLVVVLQVTGPIPVDQPTPLPFELERPEGWLEDDQVADLLLEMDAAETVDSPAPAWREFTEEVSASARPAPRPAMSTAQAAEKLLRLMRRSYRK